MARHTFVCSAGRRLDIQPCKTSPGLVQIQILSSDRQVMASCSVDASTAAVISQAFGIEAAAVESVPAKGEANCACAASSHVGPFKPPCVCHVGRIVPFGRMFSGLVGA